MEIREIIMASGVTAAVIGWWVSHYLAQKKERHFEQLKWAKAFIDSQLSELYGPIYGLLLENDRHRIDIEEIFGRSTIFVGSIPLTDEEKNIWVHYLENYYLPNNRKIVEIIKEKIHLLVGDELPKSFLSFIDYAVAFEAAHKQFNDLGKQYGFHSKTNFPIQFKSEINQEVKFLKKKQWALMKNGRIKNET